MNVAVVDPIEAKVEAADVNMIALDLIWRNVAVLGDDEQECSIELDTLL